MTFFRMMLLDAGPLGNSSPLFCDLYEKKIVVSIICGTGDIFIFCGVATFKLTQGRVREPKRINLQKTSKGGLSAEWSLSLEIMCVHVFHTIWP